MYWRKFTADPLENTSISLKATQNALTEIY
jgi:hypothetical protein